ncbi:hypothetical protein ACTHT5_11380, partial [Neisseria sp. P0022.S002]|uniref:hypothetical protein n=1 Tax=Neisseria sp. P0022.S002 TaxID=3436827 RepID=UPI003F80028A
VGGGFLVCFVGVCRGVLVLSLAGAFSLWDGGGVFGCAEMCVFGERVCGGLNVEGLGCVVGFGFGGFVVSLFCCGGVLVWVVVCGGGVVVGGVVWGVGVVFGVFVCLCGGGVFGFVGVCGGVLVFGVGFVVLGVWWVGGGWGFFVGLCGVVVGGLCWFGLCVVVWCGLCFFFCFVVWW